MITVEFDKKYEITIVLDQEGARRMIAMLQKLLNHEETHYHLMTPSFGGYELSEKVFNPSDQTINMVRLQIV